MRPPIAFAFGNLVWGQDLRDPWAVFRLATHSYAGLGIERKLERFADLVAFCESVEADFQLLRVARAWNPERYLEEQANQKDPHRAAYLKEQKEQVTKAGRAMPRVYLAVRLTAPTEDLAGRTQRLFDRRPSELFDGLRRELRGDGRKTLDPESLERLRQAADQAHARVEGVVDARPVRSPELQWLVRRGFCRGLGEPEVDGLHEPAALICETNGRAVLVPQQAEVLRWMDGYVEQHPRRLRIEGELGESHQAGLVLGALPETASFPGRRVELMFAPPEELPFPVDVTLAARFIPNGAALRVARRRVQDADQILRAEEQGEQGASDSGWERTQSARDLVSYLESSARPPLLRSTITIQAAASTEALLEKRVAACRRAWGSEVALHRPAGDQLEVFCGHLPGRPGRVAGYEAPLTVEQVAALMPTATHRVGSEHGWYVGSTLSGSRQPVRLNLREGSDRDRPTAILAVGSLGSGKTLFLQKLLYESFLDGARIIDTDPKGDHAFHQLPEVAPHAETIVLREERALRGLLDPLRVAPAHLRQDAAISFLCELLPDRAEAAWETAIVRAVGTVLTRAGEPSCTEVVRALAQGDPTERQIAETLAVHARAGLTQLAFADPEIRLPPVGEKQVTYLPIRDLPHAAPGTPRSERSRSERVGDQIVQLVALLALDVMQSERSRLKVFCFDEGWRLLQDSGGRQLLTALQRMGRSELAVPLLGTQLVTDTMTDAESMGNLLGATLVFGMRSDEEAARALALLGLDPDDRALRQRLLEFSSGQCLLRDHDGRLEAISVEIVPRLLNKLSTTPAREARGR